MKYFLRGVTVVALAIMATGCIELNMTVFVKKDGSGTFQLESVMSAETAKQFAELANMGSKKPDKDPMAELKKQMMDTTKLEKAAKDMGPGIKLVKATPVERKDGSFGVRAIFSFEDVSKLDLSKVSVGGQADGVGNGNDALGMKLRFAKGATPKLTIKMNQAKVGAKKRAPSDQEIDMQLKSMSMMGGPKISIMVTVDGKITRTNARYKSKKNDAILLVNMDFNKMMADKANLKKALKTGSDDPYAMVEAGVKGARMEKPGKTIVLEFK